MSELLLTHDRSAPAPEHQEQSLSFVMSIAINPIFR